MNKESNFSNILGFNFQFLKVSSFQRKYSYFFIAVLPCSTSSLGFKWLLALGDHVT